MKSPRNRRLLTYGAIAAGLVVVAVVGLAAYGSLQVPFQAPTVSSPVPALACIATRCG